MDDQFKREAKEKVEALNKELGSLNDRRLILEAKRNALLAYLAADEQVGVHIVHSIAQTESQSNYIGKHGNAKIPVKDQILSSAVSLLADGKPRHSADLLSHFLREGIPVGGINKILTISSILSRDDRFVANRKYGWTLAKNGKGEDGWTSSPSGSWPLPHIAVASEEKPQS